MWLVPDKMHTLTNHMKTRNLNEYTTKQEIEKFKRVISEYTSSLLANFLPDSSVDLFKQQLETYQYGSVIESILEKIFQFARGELKLRTEEEKYILKQACDTISSILWQCPASKKSMVNWTAWVKTPLGFAIKACYARLNDTLTCEELGILLGYTRQEISRRAKLSLLPHKRIGGSYVFFKKELIKKNILSGDE